MIKNNKWLVKYFDLDHTVPTIGYGLSEHKNKLKKEYHNLPKSELGKLAKPSIQLSEPIKFDKFAFICDTYSTIIDNKELYIYPYIIIEYTFLEDDDLERAKKTKHIHWKLLETTRILYKKLSKKYLCSNPF